MKMPAWLLAAVCASSAVLICPGTSWGLLAKAQGKTSCTPTAPKGSTLFQYQVNCDPVGVESFQISLSFQGNDMNIQAVNFLNGYVATDPTALQTAIDEANRTHSGMLTVAGMFPAGATPPPGEVDTFGVFFDQNANVSPDTPITFTYFAQTNDFISGFDDTGAPVFDDAAHIDPSSVTTTANLIHGVPEPASATVLASGAAAVLLGRRRRHRSASRRQC